MSREMHSPCIILDAMQSYTRVLRLLDCASERYVLAERMDVYMPGCLKMLTCYQKENRLMLSAAKASQNGSSPGIDPSRQWPAESEWHRHPMLTWPV